MVYTPLACYGRAMVSRRDSEGGRPLPANSARSERHRGAGRRDRPRPPRFEGARQAVEEATARGIPVVIIDSGLESKAIASYVSTHGKDDTNKELLFETIRDRVLAADRSKHDDDYVEKTMARREHIIKAIDGALPKYGSRPESRRRGRLVEGVLPLAQNPVLSARDAHQALKNLIDSIVQGVNK